MYSIYQFFLKKFPCHSKITAVTAEGQPRQEVLAGYESHGCSGGGGSLYRVAGVGQVSSASAAHQPLSFGLQPTLSGHTPTVRDASVWSLLNPSHRAKRGACSAQSITNPLLGPINKREGGRKEGGTERTSLGLIQIQIPKYCILYKSLKKKVRRDVKWSPGLTTKGESITPVTVQTYLCTAWLWRPLMPNHCLHGQPALFTRENCLNTPPEFL